MDYYTINDFDFIGKGAFCVIYSGENKFNQNKVAIKIEKKNTNTNFSYLLNENKVYQILKGYKQIPIIYDCFHDDNNNYLVKELLGSSLESIFKNHNKKFSLPTVLNLEFKF